MLAEAVELARIHRAELILMHVVEGAGGQWHGPQAGDFEFRHDEKYLDSLAEHLRGELLPDGVPAVRTVMGFGDVKGELVRLARREQLDLLVAGSHGHKRIADLLRGETINGVRHKLKIPVLAVRSTKPSD
jgi:manganese transport protein